MSVPMEIRGYAAFDESGEYKPFRYKPRELLPHDVMIKISACGICFSDIHMARSGWGKTHYPVCPGHEIVGTVVATGSDVSLVQTGQRVGVGPQVFSCQQREHECRMCATQRDGYCAEKVKAYGYRWANGDMSYGGYADHVLADEAHVFEIPAALSDADAAPLLCAGTTLFSPLRHFGCDENTRVGILGLGGLGHLGVQFAKAMGAHVTVLSRTHSKEALARSLGADAFVATSSEEEMKAASCSLDRLLVTANGNNLDYDAFADLVDVDGAMILVGLPEEGKCTVTPSKLVLRRMSVAGSWVGSRHDMRDMLQLAAEKGVKPMLEVAPMSDCNEQTRRVIDNEVRFRVVLTPDFDATGAADGDDVPTTSMADA
ncbi:MAG: hypothetical protein MHM6MM_003798 [Cercozoa sp. M6MM]